MVKTVTKTTAPAKNTGTGKRHAKNGKQGAKNVPANPDVGTQAGLEHENDELRAQVQALEAAANQVRLALEKDNETLRAKVAGLERTNWPQSVVPIIPKPKGNSYNLQTKMGLDDDPTKYDKIQIQAIWKRLMRNAAFKDGATFANQPKEKVVKFAKKARVTVPFLRYFKADWATEAYLRRSLRNRKGYLKRMEAKRRATGINADITLDDGASSDSEEGSSDEMDDE